jgi:hypothetical protein
MSTEIDIFSQSTGVVEHAKRDDGFSANVTASTITSKSITIQNNSFVMKVNGKEMSRTDQKHIDVVIVNISPAVHRQYYVEQYDPKAQKRKPPTCWTHDSVAPAPEVVDKQSTSCTSCPQNIAGSGPGKTKACRFSRNIAVVLASDMTGEVYRVKLSATSIFGEGEPERRPLHFYNDYLKANGESLGTVISRMTVGTDTSNIGFKAIGRLTDEQFELAKQKSQSEDAKRAIVLTVATDKTDEDGVEFEQKPIQRPVAPAPVEAIPEPVVRDTKPAEPTPAPAPKPKIDQGDISLDDLVADWEGK